MGELTAPLDLPGFLAGVEVKLITQAQTGSPVNVDATAPGHRPERAVAVGAVIGEAPSEVSTLTRSRAPSSRRRRR